MNWCFCSWVYFMLHVYVSMIVTLSGSVQIKDMTVWTYLLQLRFRLEWGHGLDFQATSILFPDSSQHQSELCFQLPPVQLCLASPIQYRQIANTYIIFMYIYGLSMTIVLVSAVRRLVEIISSVFISNATNPVVLNKLQSIFWLNQL